MTDKKKLPALIVPEAGYKLIRAYARSVDVSISEAIRQLLQESPRLVEYAQTNDIDLAVLNVGEWGGNRRAEKYDESIE